MADEGRDGDDDATATADERSSSHNLCKTKESGDSSESVVDLISSMPDDILQHILSFIPTRFAISTSILSRRWRHVWSDPPYLHFYEDRPDADSINKILARNKAPKIMSFRLRTSNLDDSADLDSWIKFALSRNVENLSLDLEWGFFNIPQLLYVSSSVKLLSVKSSLSDMIPKCSVSWTSLKKLSLFSCNLSDESIANILSGCPILEKLRLHYCDGLTKVLDLSKSPRLKTFVVYNDNYWPGPTKIVAPHIRCLGLRTSPLLCHLVDFLSLTEANVEISCISEEDIPDADSLYIMALEMLDKYQNVETLSFGDNFLKILSLAELRGSLFPKFKVKALTIETTVSHYIIPGIVRLLQNSPELKKLTFVDTGDHNCIPDSYIDENLFSHGLDPDQYWSSEARVFKNTTPLWSLEAQAVVLFIELVLKTTKTLEKMVLRFEPCYLLSKGFVQEFLEMVQVLTRNNKCLHCDLKNQMPIQNVKSFSLICKKLDQICVPMHHISFCISFVFD